MALRGTAPEARGARACARCLGLGRGAHEAGSHARLERRCVRKARLTHASTCEVLGRQTPRPRPRRMAVRKNERPRFARGRMQNAAIVAAVLACAMFQMWFSCGERCRSPNGGGLLLTFCRRGAKVCAAFILRKTVGHSARGAPTGDLAMWSHVVREAVFARQNHRCTYISSQACVLPCAGWHETAALHAVRLLFAILPAPHVALRIGQMGARNVACSVMPVGMMVALRAAR